MKDCRAIIRNGVGFDTVDIAAAAKAGIPVCNVPDYGTEEGADHAIALTLALYRQLFPLDLEAKKLGWKIETSAKMRRLSTQTFGVLGLGRIGTAAALRAKALGFKVVFYDPYRPNGADLALGIGRAATLGDLLRQSDVLSIHVPHTPETTGIIGAAELALLPQDAVVVTTARGTSQDIDALGDALRSGRIAGAGLDVVPVEPPVEPVPALMRAYRAREAWVEGRLIITPHSAYVTPEAHDDIRVKSAETMRAALFTNRPQNVIAPES